MKEYRGWKIEHNWKTGAWIITKDAQKWELDSEREACQAIDYEEDGENW